MIGLAAANRSTTAARMHAVFALARDSMGAIEVSAPITITVTTPPAPTVGIASPTDGSSFTPPASIAVAVNATPVGGAAITNNPAQQKRYVRDVRDGNKWLDVNGGRIEGKEGANSPTTHIPTHDYEFKP